MNKSSQENWKAEGDSREDEEVRGTRDDDDPRHSQDRGRSLVHDTGGQVSEPPQHDRERWVSTRTVR